MAPTVFSSYVRPALVLLLGGTVLLGLVYPLLITGFAAVAFPSASKGSLLRGADDVVIGSELLAQEFTAPKYFWPRPSATSAPYDASASAASQLGPRNPALEEQVGERIKVLKSADPSNKNPVPIDLVTTSASGLDPHISPASAEYQLARVAKARGVKEAELKTLVEKHTEGRQFGVLGEPRVNVLKLNVALDAK